MMVNEIQQDTMIEHTGHNLTVFSCRADMAGGITVVPYSVTTTLEHIMEDVGEFYGWHALTIHPHLKSFSGYDCVTINLGKGAF